jgi:hypothetical protein
VNRRAGKVGGNSAKTGILEQSGDGTDSDNTCCTAKEDPAELGATVVMSVAATTFTYFAREGINRFIFWYKAKKGIQAGDPTLLFPSWEIQVFLTQVQGLAESAGVAISSRCLPYEIGGAVVLLLLLSLLAFMIAMVYGGLKHGSTSWEHVTLKHAFGTFKETVAELRKSDVSFAHKLHKVNDSFNEVFRRGEWIDREEELTEKDSFIFRTKSIQKASKSFSDRFGSLYDSCHGNAWWYGLWSMFRYVVFSSHVLYLLEFNPRLQICPYKHLLLFCETPQTLVFVLCIILFMNTEIHCGITCPGRLFWVSF